MFDEEEEMHEKRQSVRIAYSSIAISLFCLAALFSSISLLHHQLESANVEVELRMEAFRVGCFFACSALISHGSFCLYT